MIVTEQDLKNHFEKFGEIVDCEIVMDKITKKSCGFGFICYKTKEKQEEVAGIKHVIGYIL